MKFYMEPKQANLVVMFLHAAKRINMTKKARQLLSRLLNDAAKGEVNTHRFIHAWPTLQQVHATMHSRVGRVYRYQNVPKWQRMTVVVAVFQYLFRVLPAARRTRKHLNAVAVALKDVRSRCG